MAFRLRNFAPLGPEEGLNGWLHKFAGWQRALFGISSDRYISALAAQGQPIAAVRQVDGSAGCCRICGYQMASVKSDDGWAIEACSHSMARKMIGNDRFDRWRSQLPPVESKPQSSAGSAAVSTAPVSTHMQTFSH